MKKKIFIILFGAIFALGIIGILNRQPDIEIGEVWVENKEENFEPSGYLSATRYGDSVKEENEKDFDEILAKVPTLTQEVDKASTNGQEVTGDIKVSIQGEFFGEVYYTVYDEKGEVLEEKSKELKIPTGEIEGCVVKVNVFWGKEKNYKEYEYYFKVEYNYV